MDYVRALLTIVLATVASAQTYVVDASNGPGTSFLDLPAAVVGAPDGAVLLVRPGTYSGFTLAAKGMTILGDPGVTVAGVTSVTATATGQAVTLRGLTYASNLYSSTNQLYLSDCDGAVLIEDCSLPAHIVCAGWPCQGLLAGFAAARCDQLALRGCTMLGGAEVTDCHVVIDDCAIEAEDHPIPGWTRPAALRVDGGVATVAGGTVVRGGDGCCFGGLYSTWPGSGLLWFNGTDLRVLSGTFVAGQMVGGPTFFPTYGLHPSFGARLSPFVTIQNQTGGSVGTEIMPELSGDGAPLGGALTATVRTEPGDLVALALGLPGAPTTVPGFRDALWLHPTLHVFVAMGVQQIAAPVSAQVAVPALTTFLGLRLHWQAACSGPITGLQATNPVVALVH